MFILSQALPPHPQVSCSASEDTCKLKSSLGGSTAGTVGQVTQTDQSNIQHPRHHAQNINWGSYPVTLKGSQSVFGKGVWDQPVGLEQLHCASLGFFFLFIIIVFYIYCWVFLLYFQLVNCSYHSIQVLLCLSSPFHQGGRKKGREWAAA